MDVYLGMIFPWAVPYCPPGFSFCDGSLLSVSANQALFALLGTVYGGDGRSTFGLPDLRGRVPLGCFSSGSSSPLTQRPLGTQGGAEETAILLANLTSHSHPVVGSATVSGGQLLASPNPGTTSNPAGNYLANAAYPGTPDGNVAGATCNTYTPQASAGTTVSVAGLSFSGSVQGLATQPVGGSQPIDILPPYQVLNYIIATAGLYPTRQ